MSDHTLKKLIRHSTAYASRQDASHGTAYPLYAVEKKECSLYRAERLLTTFASMMEVHNAALANGLFYFLSSDANFAGGRPPKATQTLAPSMRGNVARLQRPARLHGKRR